MKSKGPPIPFGVVLAGPTTEGNRRPPMVSGPLTNILLPFRQGLPGSDSPMPISCPNCATSYQVSPSDLGPTGRSVRCARCQQVWFATDPGEPAEVGPAQPPDVAAFAEAMADTPAAEPEAPPAPVPSEYEFRLDTLPPLADPAPDDADPAALPPPVAVAETVGEDIESVAARRAMRQAAQQRRWRQTRLSTAILALIAVNLGLIGWRTDVVRWMPQTASLYAAIGLPVNVRGLIFTNVTTEKENHDDVQVLVVKGAIVNESKHAVQIPRLRFAIHGEHGHEIYSWTALLDREVLAAGETLPFRSRLAAPPPEAHQVLVRFFNRRDLIAGVQ